LLHCLEINPLNVDKLCKLHTALTGTNNQGIQNEFWVLIDDYKTYNLQLTDVWAMKGSTATFRCVINPSYVKEYIKVVGWTQGTKPIVPGERVSFFPNGKLQIRDVRDEDRYTTYRCIARNILTKEEKVSSFAYLHVHEPPAGWTPAEIDDYSKIVSVGQGSSAELACVGRGNPLPTYRWSFQGKDLIPLSVKIDPPNQIVDSGEPAVFNCSVEGYPIKSIKWFKNGHPLVKENRMTIQDETYLTINEVNRMDQAMYQCVITNDNDGAQGTAQLLLGAITITLLAFLIQTFYDVENSGLNLVLKLTKLLTCMTVA
ncbi:hypothetical protein AM593_07185, partial [Mytilus galloprovincialis]